MQKPLIAALLLALSQQAAAVSTTFTYQGSLTNGGVPATGAFDLRFELIGPGPAQSPITLEDVPVSGGVFSVELDYGAVITSGDYSLSIGVRPGASAGAFTTLAPTTPIRPAPQAQVAAIATEAVTVSPNAVNSDSIADGSVGSADIANASVGSIDINTSQVQTRVTGTCSAGNAIASVGADGTVSCQAAGTVTSVATGAGLSGGPITSTGTIAIATNAVNSSMIEDGAIGTNDINNTQVQRRVDSSCAAGSGIRSIGADGTVVCQAAVTSISTGAGLTGGPITGSGTISIANDAVSSAMIEDGAVSVLDIDTTSVQRRVDSSCAAGSGIRSIGEDGTVICEVIPSGQDWSLVGNSGTDPTSNFLGTVDAQPLVVRTQNVQALRIEPSALLFSGGPNTSNIIAGSRDNAVTSGVRGATVMGGGAVSISEGGLPPFLGRPNRATDHYTLVAGGYDNQAGDNSAALDNAQFAAALGGNSNRAAGRSSAVLGGFGNRTNGENDAIVGGANNNTEGYSAFVAGGLGNSATGDWSVALAGTGNCAGGNSSFAAGTSAQVRPATATTVGSCASVGNSGDISGDEGTFVWADSSTSSGFISTGPNQFMVRADGGVMFNNPTLINQFDDLVIGARKLSGDDDADMRLVTRSGRNVLLFAEDDNGSLNIGFSGLLPGTPRINVSGGTGGTATLSNGGAWTNASSRSFKSDFLNVDVMDVLARVVNLPITRWNYIGSAEGTHMGPMAEDFKAAFDLAGNGKSIATVDADGVALAAIQGLNQKLEAENAQLRARLEAIEARLNGL